MAFRTIRALLLSQSALLALGCVSAQAQGSMSLPEIVVNAPSPIRGPAAPPDDAVPVPPELQGALPVVTDQFATVTVVPKEELTRTPGTTLGDVLFNKPGVTGSSFAPGASSRPIIRGMDVNRVGIVDNGIGGTGASDLGEDHFVPVDPLTTEQIEVIRGPATLRYGSGAIGGIVSATDNRIPSAIPLNGFGAEIKGAATSVDSGLDGSIKLDAGKDNFAFHADAFGRTTSDYRVPSYPYLRAPNPADAPRATQPSAFNGKQPNSSTRSNGESVGGSYIFNGGYVGLAVVQNNSTYHIPGIDGENSNTRIDARQTKVVSKGEYRPDSKAVDAIRFWLGATDYKHNELGLDDLGNDGVRQTFTNKEQEGRVEVQLAPFDVRFAALTTALGVQAGHQELTAPSPDNAGLWDPNSNTRIAGYAFNEFKFDAANKAQIAGRIEHVELNGTGRLFPALAGPFVPTSVSPHYTPKSISVGFIHEFPWSLVGSVTAQRVERAPKPAELFSGGAHDATGTFDKGNPNLGIEVANSVEAGLRRGVGPFRFEATAYYTRFQGFIYRRLTGNMCNEAGDCTNPADASAREAIYSQADATFRGGELQFQWDVLPSMGGFWGVEGQYDIVRATFTDGTNVPRIPPQRLGGGIYFRNAEWLARVNMVHAFAQNEIAPTAETSTPGYNLLRAEVSHTKTLKNDPAGIKQFTVGIVGNNLLNEDIRNHVSYTKDEVLMPGASVRLFGSVKF